MKKLYQKCAPTKQQQEDLLRRQYRKAINTAVIVKTANNWLLNWENVMAKIMKYETPESNFNL
jgi:hypothetical protein